MSRARLQVTNILDSDRNAECNEQTRNAENPLTADLQQVETGLRMINTDVSKLKGLSRWLGEILVRLSSNSQENCKDWAYSGQKGTIVTWEPYEILRETLDRPGLRMIYRLRKSGYEQIVASEFLPNLDRELLPRCVLMNDQHHAVWTFREVLSNRK